MIWTIVIWMAMQGQAAHMSTNPPATWDIPDQCDDARRVPYMEGSNVIETRSGRVLAVCVNHKWSTEGLEGCTGKPASRPVCKHPEHVFEIRTTVTGMDSCYCVGYKFCDPKDLCKDRRVTRELYMDGKRLGIIKGLD